MDYKNMESSIGDISRFVLVNKKEWHKHLKKLFDLNDEEIAISGFKECPDAPDCYYFTISKGKITDYI